jgi:hydroxyacylglutathione hydrolase
MEVHQFNALDDNYGFALRCVASGVVALVDAPDYDDIARALAAKGWTPSIVLCTHWRGVARDVSRTSRVRAGARSRKS